MMLDKTKFAGGFLCRPVDVEPLFDYDHHHELFWYDAVERDAARAQVCPDDLSSIFLSLVSNEYDCGEEELLHFLSVQYKIWEWAPNQ